MEKIYKKARAKVNLTLNIVNKREDNYHNIESVFQKISLYDELYVQKTNDNKITIKSNVKNLEGQENTIYKAYEELKKNFDNIAGVNVILKKNIPIQAGLGGGSSDCGAFIECMNKLFELDLDKYDMIKIGVKIGADVPSSFYYKPIIARKLGEEIEEINKNIKCYLVIIRPNFLCNTKEMYEKIDNEDMICQEYNSNRMKAAIEENNISKISENLYNVFEKVSNEKIDKMKQELISVGAKGSLMSGSGSAVYGIFEDKEKAKNAFKILSLRYETFYSITY